MIEIQPEKMELYKATARKRAVKRVAELNAKL